MSEPRAWCEIDLGAIGRNMSAIRAALSDEETAPQRADRTVRPGILRGGSARRKRAAAAAADEAGFTFAEFAQSTRGESRARGASGRGDERADARGAARRAAATEGSPDREPTESPPALPDDASPERVPSDPLEPAAGKGVLAVIKANAYGHGVAPVAHYLSAIGVEAFGVGDSAEGLELRAAEIREPILILGGIVDEEIEAIVRHGITPSIHSTGRARQLNLAARRLHRKIPVHLKIDTGTGRLGVMPNQALRLAQEISASSHLYLEGVFTHLATTRADDVAFAHHQAELFAGIIQTLHAHGIEPPLIHVANSATLFGGPGAIGNRVRIGAALYGMGPLGASVDRLGLEPVLSVRTQVVFLKDLPAGHPVGYNQPFTTNHATRVAVLPIGYNDGYPYTARNADVSILGRRAPVIGTVTMDYLCVDVTHIPGVHTGTPVTLIGRDCEMQITLSELAERAGTIPYAIPCLLGSRLTRRFNWPDETPRPLAAGILTPSSGG